MVLLVDLDLLGLEGKQENQALKVNPVSLVMLDNQDLQE